MQPARITPEEKAQLTDNACHQFIARTPEFYPCKSNAEKLISFVESQLGQTLEEFPYPILLEQWQAAHDHIKATSWFLERPVEEEIADPEQRRALEVANANLAAAKANEIRIAKKMPLQELGTFTSVENAKLREARDRGESPDRPVGQSSRPLSSVTLGMKAAARANVALAHPEITDRNSEVFSRLYAAELRNLRSE